MTRRRKWIFFPLALLLAGLAILILVFDWNWLKGPLEGQLSQALGRNIEIKGDFDVDLGLRPKITLEDVELANAPWGSEPTMLEADRLSVVVDVPAYLGGELVLRELALESPSLLLESNAQGEGNWNLGGQTEEAGPPQVPYIGELAITNAAIRYRREGADEIVANLEQVTGRAPQGDEDVEIQGRGTLNQRPLAVTLRADSIAGLNQPSDDGPYAFALDLDLDASTLYASGSATRPLELQGVAATLTLESPKPDFLFALAGLEARDLPAVNAGLLVSQENGAWLVRALDARFGESDLRGSAAIDLSGEAPAVQADLASSAVRMQDIRAFLGGGAPEKGAPAAAETGAALAQARAAPDAERAGGPGGPEESSASGQPDQQQQASVQGDALAALPRIEADLSYRAGRISGPEYELQDLSLEAGLHERVPSLQLVGGGQYRGEDVTLNVAFGGTAPPGQQGGQGYALDAVVDIGANSLIASGTIANPAELQGIDLQFDVASRNVGEVLQLAGVSRPEIPAFALAGKLEQQDQTWKLQDFSGRIGESALAGSVAVDRSGARPFITADLRSPGLRTSDFMLGAEGGEGEEQGEAEQLAADGPQLVTASGINFDALPAVDADIAFAGEDVQVPEFRFDQIEFDLKLREGVAVVDATGNGAFREAPLTFEIHAGTQESLTDPQARYPVDAHLESGDTVLDLRGTVAHPLDYTGLDVEARLKGPSLDPLGDILQLSLPDTPPFELAGGVAHEDGKWRLTSLKGMIGDSDVQGEVTVALTEDRPTLSADLTSKRLDFDDLGTLVGAPPDPAETAAPEQKQQAEEETADESVLPDEPFEVPELRSMDARVTFTGEEVVARDLPLKKMTLKLMLEDGRMRIEPLRFDLWQGHLDSQIALNARSDVLEGNLDMTLQRVSLGQLMQHFEIEFPAVDPEGKEGEGTLGGRAELAIRGNSIKQLAASADGKIALAMGGGSINGFIVEAMGLDAGEILGILFSGAGDLESKGDRDKGEAKESSAMVPVQCLVGIFDVQQGVMKTRALVLETTDSQITGAGQIDLGEEKLDLTFEAHPKDTSVLTASTPIQVRGPFKDPSIDVVTDELVQKGLTALGLGVVLPIVGAVIPFIETGEAAGKESPCASLFAAAEQQVGGATRQQGN